MNQEFVIQSDQDDEYRLRITSEHIGMLSEDVLQELMSKGIQVIDIELERTKGDSVTSPKVLAKIEECIADVFLSHRDVMICFFCDFISLIPSSNKKNMSVQEYRSRLFSNMFERYINCHHISGIRNQVVTVKGIAEDYYAHVIVREEHIYLAKIIGEGIQKDFGK